MVRDTIWVFSIFTLESLISLLRLLVLIKNEGRFRSWLCHFRIWSLVFTLFLFLYSLSNAFSRRIHHKHQIVVSFVFLEFKPWHLKRYFTRLNLFLLNYLWVTNISGVINALWIYQCIVLRLFSLFNDWYSFGVFR